MKISGKDFSRYNKQIILKNIGFNGQKKIFNTKVLIVGVGGLGSPLAIYLASMGIGSIGIIDHDKIELSNLNRQILYNTSDVGKKKTVQAKKYLQKINKKVILKTFQQKADSSNIKKIAKNYDIICDCSDNFQTRYLINNFCFKNKKKLISAAISKFETHIFNFDFSKKVPCYQCFMPNLPSNNNACDAEGILPSVAGIAGTIQANEVIKSILFKKNNLERKLLIFNSLNLSFKLIKLSKDPKCRTCSAKNY